MMGPTLRFTPGARRWLVLACALSAYVFGWAELTLPPRWNTPLGLTCAALALLHALAAGSASFAPALLPRALKLLAWASLAAALGFVGALGGSSIQLVHMYGALGWGLAALLGVIAILLLALTVPFALLSLRLTRAPLAGR